ncbi:MAG: AraC family transcriptional regulator [Raineya sp.]|jgi:AraC-like DNA-binding protein|nr:AraC family transcriptional regulator [Raineya sp.]
MFSQEALIKHENKNIGTVVFSMLTQYHANMPFKNFAIKYVWEGVETYQVNGKNYILQKDQYLLANQYAEGSILIDSKRPVKGICIDIKHSILSEALASFRRPDTEYVDLNLDTFFATDCFVENQYQAKSTHLGLFLNSLGNKIIEEITFTEDFYYTICEKLIQDHIPIYKQLQIIPTIKYDTKKHLFRCVYRGKEFIDSHFTENLSIEQIAQEASLSQYHFFRLFKNIYQQTPYQYIHQKRLLFAKQALESGHYSVSDVAIIAGFPDIYTFSKAFKKMYKITPSTLIKL